MPRYILHSRPRDLGMGYKTIRDSKTLMPHVVEAENPEQACRQFQGEYPCYFNQHQRRAVWGTRESPADTISGEMYAELEPLDAEEE